MSDPIADFLAKHRSSSQWLDDIVNVLLNKPRGTAHVSEIARDLWYSEKRDINSIEETITRRINDYCSDAADFAKTLDHDLFQQGLDRVTGEAAGHQDCLYAVGCSCGADIRQLAVGGALDSAAA